MQIARRGFLFGRHREDFVCLHAPGRQEGMLSRDQTMDILFLHKRSAGSLLTPVTVAITPPRPSKLDYFKDYLRQRFEEHGLSGVRLTEEIRKMGFSGSERLVRRFLATLGLRMPSQLTIRFETPPGEQGQANWAEAGQYHLPDGCSSS